MLAPVTPVWAVRDLFLAMGLGAWLCVGYTLLRAVLGGARWAVFTCDALAAFGALLAWRAAAVSIFYAGVPRWYTLCGMAAAFLALRALLAAPARCLRALLLRLARHAGGPLAGGVAPRGPKPPCCGAQKPRGKAPAPRRAQKTRAATHKTVAKARAGVV